MEYKHCLTELIVYTKNCMIRIAYSEIVLLRMDSGYTVIELHSGQTHQIDLPLKVLEDILPDYFFRVNRSEIVNMNSCVTCRMVNGKGTVKLHTGKHLLISRRRICFFKERFVGSISESGHVN